MKSVLLFTLTFIVILNLTSSTVINLSIDIPYPEEKQTIDEQPESYLTDQEIFDNFLADFNIELPPLDTYESRLEIFINNYRKIRQHNERYYQGLENYQMGLNQFTHFSDSEMSDYVSGLNRNLTQSSLPVEKFEITDEEFEALPKGLNWVDKNALQPVQNQGQCGSCYAFSAIASIEAQMIIHYNNREKLSEQEAMECTKGCRGGNEDEVYNYSKRKGGCASERAYPYKQHVVSQCTTHGGRVKNSKVVSYKTMRSERDIMGAVTFLGPVSIGMDVHQSFFHYHSGIYHTNGGSSDPKKGAHAVVIVGYGVESGRKYWLVRNSWGQGWGERGYFKMLRDVNECNVAHWESFVPRVE